MATGASLPDTLLVIDNDVFTHWRNQRQDVLSAIADYFKRLKQPPALTSTTIFEALWGVESEAAKGRIQEERAQQYRSRIEELSRACLILPFEQKAAALAAYIFPRLSNSGRSKHWRDLFIAATALAHGYGIATRNKKDFDLIANHIPMA